MLFVFLLILLMVGGSMADGENLVIPTVIVAVGLGLMWLGARVEGRHETE